MIGLLIIIMEVLSLICLTIVSISLFRVFVQRKDRPPLLMGIAYSITDIIVALYLIDRLFTPPGDFLGLDLFFTKMPLLLLILSPSFMWLFKLEVFDDGIRANQLKVIIYSFFTSIHYILPRAGAQLSERTNPAPQNASSGGGGLPTTRPPGCFSRGIRRPRSPDCSSLFTTLLCRIITGITRAATNSKRSFCNENLIEAHGHHRDAGRMRRLGHRSTGR